MNTNSNVLLDTCSFIWIISDPSKLSKNAQKSFVSKHTNIFLSIVSIWEILIKKKVGTVNIQPNTNIKKLIFEMCRNKNITLLNLEPDDIFPLQKIENHHKDPFDRILISQAMNRKLKIMTPDKKIHKYKVDIIW